MRKRWMQLVTAMLCGLGGCASDRSPATTNSATTTAATTKSVAPAPPPIADKHEPVAPPPLPSSVPEPPVHPVKTQPATPPMPVAATQPGPIDDRLAYTLGFAAARRLRDQLSEDDRKADPMQVLRGMMDGISDHDPAYPQAGVQQEFAEFQAYNQQRRAEKLYADNPSFRKQADDNLKKSRALLDQNAEMAGVDVRPDGVQIQVLAPGNGRVVGNAHTLTVKNLRVSLADGTMLKSTGGDAQEKIPVSDILPAVVDAIRGQKTGVKCRVWLPPDKAFGLVGKPPVIGPNQAIEYEFELANAE